jgi:hypothetical protein
MDDSRMTEKDAVLLAIKVVIDTINPEGLCPTLLVYGSIPRPARDIPQILYSQGREH